MEQVAMVKLSTKRNERIYTFEMPIGSPYGEAYDAAHEVLQQITKMAHEAAERVKREDVSIKTDEVIEEES